jgi:hypothetical protein
VAAVESPTGQAVVGTLTGFGRSANWMRSHPPVASRAPDTPGVRSSAGGVELVRACESAP